MKAIQELDSEIIGKVRKLNGVQKNDVLGYLEKMPGRAHSSGRHKRRAMKQIRHALANQSFSA